MKALLGAGGSTYPARVRLLLCQGSHEVWALWEATGDETISLVKPQVALPPSAPTAPGGLTGPRTYSTWIQKLFYLPILPAVLLFQAPEFGSHQIHITFLHM